MTVVGTLGSFLLCSPGRRRACLRIVLPRGWEQWRIWLLTHLSLAWGLFPEMLTSQHFQSAWHPACSCGQRKLSGKGRQVWATENYQCVQECWVPRGYEWCQKYLLQRHSWLYRHYWSFLLMRGNQKTSNQGWQDTESINCYLCSSSPIFFPDRSLHSSPQPPGSHWRSG